MRHAARISAAKKVTESTSGSSRWVTDENVALLTDLYELTMVQAYWREGMHQDAVFSLYVRRLPRPFNFLVACGLDDALSYLEALRFDRAALEYLAGRPEFSAEFVAWLGALRFTGEVRAVSEGTPVFADEPILEVRAPLPQAQLVETMIMNQVHLQTVLASKAARVVLAASGRPVVDFGLRRMHGADAGLKSARAFRIAGVASTSNVLAGHVYGVPLSGTMGHAYIQAHGDEMEAFRRFVQLYPDSVLLVDTYDTLHGVRTVARLANELGDRFRVRAVRLDSGDLRQLAAESRRILDEAGLTHVQIFASGGLDEYSIAELLAAGAPIDGFGVGTRMGVSANAPALDIAYKLVEYAGQGRTKLSPAKLILPGPKQVWRHYRNGSAAGDIIGSANEDLEGTPLLQPVMKNGKRLAAANVPLESARARASAEIGALPAALLGVEPAGSTYPVRVSSQLDASQLQLRDALRRGLEDAWLA
jgi:nicotinate phosphoribosyltransferase